MTIFKELDYTSEISMIIGLQFSVSSPEEIREKISCKCNTSTTI